MPSVCAPSQSSSSVVHLKGGSRHVQAVRLSVFYKDVVLAERALNERARGGFLQVVLQDGRILLAISY